MDTADAISNYNSLKGSSLPDEIRLSEESLDILKTEIKGSDFRLGKAEARSWIEEKWTTKLATNSDTGKNRKYITTFEFLHYFFG